MISSDKRRIFIGRRMYIRYFFSFWRDIPPGIAFPKWGFAHIVAIITIFLLVILILTIMNFISLPARKRLLYIMAIIEPLLEISHIVWLWCVGETDIVKLLPLHLCTMQMFFLPLAVFYRRQTLREFTFFSSILGGILAILSPAGVCDTYPFFHFQTLQTFAVHALLILIPLALLLYDNFYPNIQNLPRFFLFSAFVVLPVAIVDFMYHENYMFLCTPPPGSILTPLYATIGLWGYRLLLIGSASVFILTAYLLFEYGRKRGLQKRLYRVR